MGMNKRYIKEFLRERIIRMLRLEQVDRIPLLGGFLVSGKHYRRKTKSKSEGKATDFYDTHPFPRLAHGVSARPVVIDVSPSLPRWQYASRAWPIVKRGMSGHPKSDYLTIPQPNARS